MKTPRGAVEGQPKVHDSRRLIVGISGALGIIYGVHALQLLRGLGITTHLVMSKSAEVTLAYETDFKPADRKPLLRSIIPLATSTWRRYVKGWCPRLE